MVKIIAIQGNKNAGKDTIALYAQWLLSTPRILHWYWCAKLFNFQQPWFCRFHKRWYITRYANKLKKILALLLNIDESLLEDREFKEYFHVNFNSFVIYDSRLQHTPKCPYISDKNLARELKKGTIDIPLQYDLSIRQLLQFIGTDIFRRIFGDKIWIYNTLNYNKQQFIIADQRFVVEYDSLVCMPDNYTIHIVRPNNYVGYHASEKELIKLLRANKFNSLVYNDGSLKDLFYKCKQIIKTDYYGRNH